MIPENGTKNHSLWKKRRKKKFNKVFILLIVLVYIVSRTTPILTENSNQFHTITYGTLEDSLSFEGIILRDEKVLTNHSRGMKVESGERVAKGQEISAGLNSPSPGTIAKNRDGFEESLDLTQIIDSSEPDLELLQELLDKEGIDIEDGIRLITGYRWGTVGLVPLEEAEEIQPGQRIWIEAQNQRVHGRILWIQEKENTDNAFVLVESSEYLAGIYDYRKMDFSLIKRKVEGLSIPIDAVYYQEDQAYVTQRKTEKNLQVPVNIILADQERAIISSDQFTDADGEERQTISLYDEILLDQSDSKGKEGLNE